MDLEKIGNEIVWRGLMALHLRSKGLGGESEALQQSCEANEGNEGFKGHPGLRGGTRACLQSFAASP